MAWRQHGPGATPSWVGPKPPREGRGPSPIRTPALAKEERLVLHKEVDPHSYVIGLYCGTEDS